MIQLSSFIDVLSRCVAGAPQHCGSSSAELGFWAHQDLSPLPQMSLLLPVSCKMTTFLMTGSGLQTFYQSMCGSCQQATVPLAWTRLASAGRTGCLILCMDVFSPQLQILRFHLHLENQCSWTESVCARLVCSCCIAGFPQHCT